MQSSNSFLFSRINTIILGCLLLSTEIQSHSALHQDNDSVDGLHDVKKLKNIGAFKLSCTFLLGN